MSLVLSEKNPKLSVCSEKELKELGEESQWTPIPKPLGELYKPAITGSLAKAVAENSSIHRTSVAVMRVFTVSVGLSCTRNHHEGNNIFD